MGGVCSADSAKKMDVEPTKQTKPGQPQNTTTNAMPSASSPTTEIEVERKDDNGEDEEEEETMADDLIAPGKKINRDDFKIIKVIGKGSFGKVFLVKKKDGGDQVYAMKVLNKQMVAKRNLVIKTQAEREIMGAVVSPFIVTLYFAFQTTAKLYFIMDFMNGGELFTHLRKDKYFKEQRACFYSA